MDLLKKIEDLEKLHRLDMVRRCLSSISDYVNDSVTAIDDDMEYNDEKEINNEISAKIISRVKDDLSTLIDKYL